MKDLTADSLSWYVLSTRSNKEGDVFKKLVSLNIECYLPLNRFLMLWGDKERWIIKPLFQNYLFVRTNNEGLNIISKVKNVKDILKKSNKVITIPDEYIEFIKRIIATKEKFEIRKFKITKGDKVIIEDGPLKGLTVHKVKYVGQEKAIINIPSINFAVLFDVNSRVFQYSDSFISEFSAN